MSLSDRDLERMERQSERARRDPGTDRTPITRVKATVDTGGAHGEEVEVNGHKARNLAGVTLEAGDVCFVELWDGKRAVFHAFRGPRMAAGTVTFNTDENGASETVTFPAGFSSVPVVVVSPGYPDDGDRSRMSAAVADASTSGCTIYGRRVDGGSGSLSVTYQWIATEPG